MNKVLVLSGNYRPNFRDMVAFRNSGKDAVKEWEKERNTRIVDNTGTGRGTAVGVRGVYRKEFGIRYRADLREAA